MSSIQLALEMFRAALAKADAEARPAAQWDAFLRALDPALLQSVLRMADSSLDRQAPKYSPKW